MSRVLTSSDNLSLLREKEKNKKEAADEKQRQKEEWEKKSYFGGGKSIERDNGYFLWSIAIRIALLH